MSYQALYRKYRPRNFDEVVGQKQIVQTLKNALATDQIAHAYLFTGPRGTGKTSLAKIFAKALNCTGEIHPCNTCPNCKLASSGSHPDIIEIDAASNNGVDEVRNLIERVTYAPIEGKYKIYIIDEVHMMTSGAFNALLKTIEEPPAHVVFIFATTEPQKVLSTILSRCQRYDFSKVSDKDIIFRLKSVCESENISIDEDALQLIASLSDGGMRDSLSILDQSRVYCQNNISASMIREIYGVATLDDITSIFKHLNPSDIKTAMENLQRLADSGVDLKRFTSDFIAVLKNSLLLDFSSATSLVPSKQKEIILIDYLNISTDKRLNLLNNLMDIYGKFNVSSNVLDYLQIALMKSVYEGPSEKGFPFHETPKKISEKPNKRDEQKTVSDYSEKKISENAEANSKSLEKMFWKSDVSRETFYEQSHSSLPNLEEENILGLLKIARKEERAADTQFLKSLNIYMSDLNLAKCAVSLRGHQILASGNDYLIIIMPDQKRADEVNEIQKQEGYEKFTNTVLQKPKQVMALSASYAKNLIQIFKKRMQEGTLPDPEQIKLRVINNENSDSEEDPEIIIKSYFPNVDVIND